MHFANATHRYRISCPATKITPTGGGQVARHHSHTNIVEKENPVENPFQKKKKSPPRWADLIRPPRRWR